ncbi:MAG: hypothetical protein H0U54_06720 [Acidobacteria bacterium]|nr:hypothetical protein [Acidobacteriota bacterium]
MSYVRVTDDSNAGSSGMKRSGSLQKREKESYNMNTWTIVGGLALVAVAAVVVVSLPDIKRYIKISTM